MTKNIFVYIDIKREKERKREREKERKRDRQGKNIIRNTPETFSLPLKPHLVFSMATTSFVFSPLGIFKNYNYINGIAPTTTVSKKFNYSSKYFTRAKVKQIRNCFLQERMDQIAHCLVPEQTPNGILVHFIPQPEAPIIKDKTTLLQEIQELKRRLTLFKQMDNDQKKITEIVIDGTLVKIV